VRRHQSHVYRQDRTVFKYPLRFICYLIVAVNYCRQLHRNGSSCDLRVMLVAQRDHFKDSRRKLKCESTAPTRERPQAIRTPCVSHYGDDNTLDGIEVPPADGSVNLEEDTGEARSQT